MVSAAPRTRGTSPSAARLDALTYSDQASPATQRRQSQLASCRRAGAVPGAGPALRPPRPLHSPREPVQSAGTWSVGRLSHSTDKAGPTTTGGGGGQGGESGGLEVSGPAAKPGTPRLSDRGPGAVTAQTSAAQQPERRGWELPDTADLLNYDPTRSNSDTRRPDPAPNDLTW